MDLHLQVVKQCFVVWRCVVSRGSNLWPVEYLIVILVSNNDHHLM